MREKTIRIKIHEESDLFSAFDPDRNILSEDMTGYIIRCFQNMKTNPVDNGVIQVCSDVPVDEESVAEKIRENFRREKEVINRSLKRMMLKAACLGVFGVAVITVWFFLAVQNESVNLEILSIIGSVAVWEATNILLIERQAPQRSKKNMDKIINSRIEFQNSGE